MWVRTMPYHIEQDAGFAGPEEGYAESIEVFEEEWGGWTGLLDAEGNPIFKPKPRMGFIQEDGENE